MSVKPQVQYALQMPDGVTTSWTPNLVMALKVIAEVRRKFPRKKFRLRVQAIGRYPEEAADAQA